MARDAGHEQPLMIGIDQENGLVAAFSTTALEGGTHFPGAMAQAATRDTSIAESIAVATARELKLAGVNWVYSPVADINSDPSNPVIGVRSYGDDPQEVTRFVLSVSRGLTSQGVAPSPKHFPGHGDTAVDSHIGLPVISKTIEELSQTELAPFKALVTDASVATIMTGHMALPKLTPDNPELPASLSRAITTDLLRGKLGFDGVVVTDCLEMDAVVDAFGTEKGAVEALKAGADVAMICHTYERQKGAIEEAYQAAVEGTLNAEGLRSSAERIRKLKSTFAGTWDTVLDPRLPAHDDLPALLSEHRQLAERAHQKSIAVIRNPPRWHDPSRSQPSRPLLPLSLPNSDRLTPGNLTLVLSPEMEALNRAVDDAENIQRTADGKVRNTAGPSYEAFGEAVRARISGAPFEHVVYTKEEDELPTLPNKLKASMSTSDSIIFLMRNGGLGNGQWQLSILAKILNTISSDLETPPKIVVVATCGPYDLLNEDDIQSFLGEESHKIPYAYVASFEFTVGALLATAKVIYGDIEAVGTCPVKSASKKI